MKKNLVGSTLRLYVALACIASSVIGFLEPRSLMYLIANQSDPIGAVLLWAFVTLGVFGLFDVVFNDLLATSRKTNLGTKLRQSVFMGISICYASEMFIGIHFSDTWSSFPLFVIHSIFSAIAAFLDVHTSLGSKTENEQIQA